MSGRYGKYPIVTSILNSLWAKNDDPDITYGDFAYNFFNREYPGAMNLISGTEIDPRGKDKLSHSFHEIVGSWFGSRP